MKVSTILDHIDSGHMALPEFQRGYVWNRDQVRGLMDSLYRRHPVGSLLVWATNAETAKHRGEGDLAPGTVKLILDGQQRMTTLYGIIRGKPPQFFDGQSTAFTGLYFHLENQEFAFYQPIKMKDDLLWIDVSRLMEEGNDGLGSFFTRLGANPQIASRAGALVGHLNRILGIRDIDLHVDEVTGVDKSIDVVVDIFNRVNSGGTKLSKGDLALAKICAEWPKGRDRMRATLRRWREHGYQFDLDWFLRNINTIVTGEAKFVHLHDIEPARVRSGLDRAEKCIDSLLNIIAGRLGLDHHRVLFGRHAMPVMVHYIDRRGGHLDDAVERDKLLFWYLHSAMWGRFSGSTETVIDQDLKVLEELDGGLDRLINELRLWHGSLEVSSAHFGGYSVGARFYPMLYMLTRIGEARDWGLGVPLKQSLLGKMSKLEVHHIFPRKQLRGKYRQAEINAVANFCFQTKDTNLQIGTSPPSEYFPKIDRKHPGALASQWIPMEPELWEVENYLEFLDARKQLLADAANSFLTDLLHGTRVEEREMLESDQVVSMAPDAAALPVASSLPGSVGSEEEEEQLLALNEWVVQQALPEGECLYELARADSGEPVAVLDLAWPNGLQEGLSEPVAVLLNEAPETLAAANAHGFRYFTSVEDFKRHVAHDVLVLDQESGTDGL